MEESAMATRSNSNYSVSGRITNRPGTPLAGITVRAYDQDPNIPANPLGSEAITDMEGRYRINFQEQDFKLGGVERGGPDVFIRAYDGEQVLGESKVKRSAGRRVTINLRVDSAQGDAGHAAWRVHGVVRDASSVALPGITVQAFDRDLRSEQALGTAQTDPKGFYQIEYSPRQFTNREKDSADLVIKAFSPAGASLAESPILFNAPPDAELDLTVPAAVLPPPPLFEKIALILTPLLGDVPIADLEQDQRHQDVSFLAGETGLEKSVLARFIHARKLVTNELPAEFWFALLGSSIYEFSESTALAEQSAKFLDALPSLDADAARKALARSFNQNEISSSFQKNTDMWV